MGFINLYPSTMPYTEATASQDMPSFSGLQLMAPSAPVMGTGLPSGVEGGVGLAGNAASGISGSAATMGIGAAGQAASTLASVLAQKAIMDQNANQAALGRASNERINKMQIASNALMGDRERQANAYKMLLDAFGGQIKNVGGARENARNATNSFTNDVMGSMLSGKGKASR